MVPETEAHGNAALAIARAEVEMLRIEVEIARQLADDASAEEGPFLHDLSPLGQRTLGAI